MSWAIGQRFYPTTLEEARLDIPYEDFVQHKFSRRCVRNFYEYPDGSRITNRSQLPTPGQAPEPGFNNVLFLWLDHLHESMSKKELKKLGKLVSLFPNLEVC